jgi:hypothetical protein
MLLNSGNITYGGGLLGASGLALLWILFGNKGNK